MGGVSLSFVADKVKVKTGNVDNSATVTFFIGEYQLKHIKELVDLVDKNLKVTVSEYKEYP